MDKNSKKISILRKILRKGKPFQLVYEILQLLWGYPLYLLSFICPRNKKKWVFGHRNGFADNAKYLYLYMLKMKKVEVYWITRDKKLIKWMRSRNLPVYHRYSLKGIYHCLTSYWYIYANTSDAINYFTSGNSRLINLWHGVGFKNMMVNPSGMKDNLLFKIGMPYLWQKPDYLLVPTPSQREYFKKVFSLSDKHIIDGMYPRCSFLRQKLSDILEHIKRYESQQIADLLEEWKRYDTIYLYMPTWRANMESKYLDVAFCDMGKLDKTLKKKNALLIIKQHPMVKENKASRSYDNIYFINNRYDIYPILPFTDILITDYSSIYSDYILLEGKGVILYPFDIEDYQKDDFELIDYKENASGTYVYTFPELLELIESPNKCTVPNRDFIVAKFWGDYKNKSIETLYSQLMKIS